MIGYVQMHFTDVIKVLLSNHKLNIDFRSHLKVGCTNKDCQRWFHKTCIVRFEESLVREKYPASFLPTTGKRWHCPLCGKTIRKPFANVKVLGLSI